MPTFGARVVPPSYVRPRRNKWQARPRHPQTGERVNLGLFATEFDARRAVAKFLRGELQALPKFVRKTEDDPPKYFWHVQLDKVNVLCDDVLHDTPADAARHVRQFLTKVFGPLFAAVALSRAQTRTNSNKV